MDGRVYSRENEERDIKAFHTNLITGGFALMYLSVAIFILFGLIAYTGWVIRKNKPREIWHRKPQSDEDIRRIVNDSIIKDAEREVNVFHGDFHGDFFITDDISDAMKKAEKTRLIFGPQLCVCLKKEKVTKFFRMVKNKDVELYQLKNVKIPQDNKYFHFATVDRRHVWLEKPHGPRDAGASTEYFDEWKLTTHYNKIFENLLSIAKKIRPDHIIEDIGEENLIIGYINGTYIKITEEKLKELKEITSE